MVVQLTYPDLEPPCSRVEINREPETNVELYKAICKIKRIADSVCPVLQERGHTEMAQKIATTIIKADEDVLLDLLQTLYIAIEDHLFPINCHDFMSLEDVELHLECIPIEPVWLEPIGQHTQFYDGPLPVIDGQLHDIFVEGCIPIEESHPELGIVALNGAEVAKELIQTFHGNSWKHCFGWYLLALVHETGSWFYDEEITDEWIYEEIWADTEWTAAYVRSFALAYDTARKIGQKISRFQRWIDKNPKTRCIQLLTFVQDFQHQKIRTYWQEENERFFRRKFADDAAGLPPDPHTTHPMGLWEDHQLPGRHQ